MSAIVDRPSTGPLVMAIIALVVGWALHRYAEQRTRSPRPQPTGDRRPGPLESGAIESPAVVGLLTNGFEAPMSAMTATTLDLATRGWVRLTRAEGELVVVARGSGAAGDTLQPYEQQVRNHIAAQAFNDVASAGTLAASQHRLRRRWWLRFRRGVARHSAQLGLSTTRYTTTELAPPAASAAIGLIAAWSSIRNGDPDVAFADSWRLRALWAATLVGLLVLVWRTVERGIAGAQRPTVLGAERAAEWMGFRRRLRSRIPAGAGVLAAPEQQSALALAVVMGVAEHTVEALPVAPEDDHRAWSEAGGTPHVVHVWYPMRPGYGQHPVVVGVAGFVVLVVAWWLRGYLGRVADGEALTSLLERVPGQIDLVERIAEVLSWACLLPMAFGLWATFAGAVDSVATRERTGMVVRARRPSDVVPFASLLRPFTERNRFSVYLAVDDGRRRRVVAWLASERTAAPQGAQARIRATPLLGYVRSSEPVGTATRPSAATGGA